jgi:hypothetical protein
MLASRKQFLIGILWPSFWMAIFLSGIVFSALDPVVIASHIGFQEVSALGAYTIGFFFFWGACAWSGFFSIIFSQRP